MTAQVIMLVKVPITEIEEWIRTKYDLPPLLSDFKIEENNLVLHFREDENADKGQNERVPSATKSRRRRAHRKRNRMRTRGWKIVGRITNSNGQKCTIYKPFVDALQDTNLTNEEQKRAVERILRSNRNRPSEVSIRYFLENTLEFLNSKTDKQAQRTED
jgi:hypothetical protein